MAHTYVSVTIDDPSELSLDRCQMSSIEDQGVATTVLLGSIRLTGYSALGCTPSQLSARLRELADEIDLTAVALVPDDMVEAVSDGR